MYEDTNPMSATIKILVILVHLKVCNKDTILGVATKNLNRYVRQYKV